MRTSLLRNTSVSGSLPLKLFTGFKSLSVWEVGQGPNNNSNKGNTHKTAQPAFVHKTQCYDSKNLQLSELSKIPTGAFHWLRRTQRTTQERWSLNARLKLFKKPEHLHPMTMPSVMFPCSPSGRSAAQTLPDVWDGGVYSYRKHLNLA